MSASDQTKVLSRDQQFYYSKYGTVQRVDYENWLVDVKYSLTDGHHAEAKIGAAFTSPRAFLGGMPEIGSSVLVDYTYAGPSSGKPNVASYLPSGFRAGMNQKKQKLGKYDYGDDVNVPRFRRKFRKIYPGEIMGSSSQGSDLILDENVSLSDMKGGEVRLDPRDQSLNQISVQSYSITDAARHSNGWVYRPVEESYNEDGSLQEGELHKPPDSRQPYVIDESSKKRWYRTISGIDTVDDYFLSYSFEEGKEKPTNFNASPLVEVRSEIREVGFGTLPLVDQNVEKDLWWDNNLNADSETGEKDPKLRRGNIIETASGTLVGYDKNHDNYGKVLRPQIFADKDGTNLDVKEIPVEEGALPDYAPVRMLAAAHMWKMPFPHAQTRMYVSKEGHVQLHVGGTTEKEESPFLQAAEHPYGAGRSVEAHFGGSIKAVIDKNQGREESLDIKTLGKAYMHFGKDDGIPSAESRELSVDDAEYKGSVTKPTVSGQPQSFSPEPTATSMSIETVTDGGISVRVGKNSGKVLRKFEQNGYNARGDSAIPVADGGGGANVRNVGRQTYESGDRFYRHHKMTLTGYGAPGRIGFPEDYDEQKAKRDEYDKFIKNPGDAELEDPGNPLGSPDIMATSLDMHMNGSAFIRAGADDDGNSLIMDTAGGVVAWLGADKRDNRSLVFTSDGGIEAHIGRTDGAKGKGEAGGNSIQALLEGGVDIVIRSNQKGQDIKIRKEGNIIDTQIGDHHRTHVGNIFQKVTVDNITEVGGVSSLAVTKNRLVNIGSTRATTIGNANLPPNEFADKTVITTGNSQLSIQTKGDIIRETVFGDLLMKTLRGNAELKTLVGNIIVETLKGDVELYTSFGKVKIGSRLGVPKYGVVTQASPCQVTGLPHMFGSPDVCASDFPPSVPPFPIGPAPFIPPPCL
jgi:hypothetical protein